MPYCMAPVVRCKVCAGNHCAHHVCKGPVGPFCDDILKGCAIAGGFKGIFYFIDAGAECGSLHKFTTLVCAYLADTGLLR